MVISNLVTQEPGLAPPPTRRVRLNLVDFVIEEPVR
jgi:hypothetical protein